MNTITSNNYFNLSNNAVQNANFKCLMACHGNGNAVSGAGVLNNRLSLSQNAGDANIAGSRSRLIDALMASASDEQRANRFSKDFGTSESVVSPQDQKLQQRLAQVPFQRANGTPDKQDIVNLQKFLAEQGFDCGTTGADGLYGKDTHNALNRYLASQNNKNTSGFSQGSGNALVQSPVNSGVPFRQNIVEGPFSKGTAFAAAIEGQASRALLQAAGKAIGDGGGLARQAYETGMRKGIGASILREEAKGATSEIAKRALTASAKTAQTEAEALMVAKQALGTTGRVLEGAAKIAGPSIAIAGAALEIGQIAGSNQLTTQEKVTEGAGAAGSAYGAWEGAAIGAAYGTPLGLPGVIGGGIIGGLVGSEVGRFAGRKVGEAWNWATN